MRILPLDLISAKEFAKIALAANSSVNKIFFIFYPLISLKHPVKIIQQEIFFLGGAFIIRVDRFVKNFLKKAAFA